MPPLTGLISWSCCFLALLCLNFSCLQSSLDVHILQNFNFQLKLILSQLAGSSPTWSNRGTTVPSYFVDSWEFHSCVLWGLLIVAGAHFNGTSISFVLFISSLRIRYGSYLDLLLIYFGRRLLFQSKLIIILILVCVDFQKCQLPVCYHVCDKYRNVCPDLDQPVLTLINQANITPYVSFVALKLNSAVDNTLSLDSNLYVLVQLKQQTGYTSSGRGLAEILSIYSAQCWASRTAILTQILML